MKGIFLAVCLLLSTVSAGCLSAQHSTGVGAAGGAGIGAGIGVALGNPALGILIGAGLGALGGAFAQDHLEKKQKEKEAKELQEQLFEGQKELAKGSLGPTSKPTDKSFIEGHYEYVMKKKWIDTSKKERVWVVEKVEGDRRIEGHYENRLVPSGYWEAYEEKIWVPDHYE
ncbi:MAG: glycine zipper domain-containing protein [Candidatus Brocadiales bacterium]